MHDIALVVPALIAVTGALVGLVQAYRLRDRAHRALARTTVGQAPSASPPVSG